MLLARRSGATFRSSSPLCRAASRTAATRRGFLAAGVSGAAAAAGVAALGVAFLGVARASSASGFMEPGATSAPALVRRGMQRFREGDVGGSLAAFDAALSLDANQRPYLWQRGLSLYYAGQFEEGAKQFRDDVAVNPNDTEESIWAALCEARLSGFEAAQQNLLVVGRDSRPVMRSAYELFAGRGTLEALAAAGEDGSPHDAFYSLLYQGLFHEAKGEDEAAKAAVVAAVATPYGTQSGDYMASLAAVHAKQRGWM